MSNNRNSIVCPVSGCLLTEVQCNFNFLILILTFHRIWWWRRFRRFRNQWLGRFTWTQRLERTWWTWIVSSVEVVEEIVPAVAPPFFAAASIAAPLHSNSSYHDPSWKTSVGCGWRWNFRGKQGLSNGPSGSGSTHERHVRRANRLWAQYSHTWNVPG